MKKLAIIAAVQEEFQLILLDKEALEKKWDCQIIFEEIGVGPINAASNAGRLLDKYPDSEFLLVGSCGRYVEDIPLMQPVSPVRHSFGNLEIALGRGYIPEFAFEPFEIEPFPDVRSCSCLTTPNITANDEAKVQMAKHYQTQIEHLESYAALKPLVMDFRPVRALLVPVNDTGPGAHNQFIENVASGLAVLNEFVIKLENYPWIRE